MNSPLARWKSRDDLTLEEVVDAADALLREVAPKQTRYAVAERPDVRTVRYYTTRGLLPKPLSYDGGRARYGFAHLVRLLAIKKLQADRFTLDQIARALANKSDDAVEALVAKPASPIDAVPVPSSLDFVPRSRAVEREEAREAHAREYAHDAHGHDVHAHDAHAHDAHAHDAHDAHGHAGEHAFEVAPGVRVVVAQSVLGDAEKRQQLAKNLEDIARLLRAFEAKGGEHE